ncbi:hypothetical protein MmiEs2_07720 [Methanimicrococcus stummii]|uniref:Uncharacterized protein n=1 Tax=Methanimicrococcus stummii TaxID=3028294 RepID=A0AA96VLQ0_9EURY|nr:hypothetical protein [Methanimicrococcus sp. Es2]WNY28577.1 hypothetical protein MmiEs2_07720 [Methanimicrococcus sp. Es2]
MGIDLDRTFDKECVFTKNESENKITGVLSVSSDVDNESAVSMNGARVVSPFVPGIQYIHLERNKGIIYNYRIHVYGACPSEYKTMELFFKDGEDKIHKITIRSESDKWHTERYNSDKSEISEISWEFTKKD